MAVYGYQTKQNGGRVSPAASGFAVGAGSPPCGREKEKPRAEEACGATAAPPPAQSTSPFSFLDGLLGNIHIDGEKVLLVLILIILAKDGADLKLLLALGYLLI